MSPTLRDRLEKMNDTERAIAEEYYDAGYEDGVEDSDAEEADDE